MDLLFEVRLTWKCEPFIFLRQKTFKALTILFGIKNCATKVKEHKDKVQGDVRPQLSG